ncbi:hypothetical protein [Sediminitomix flava]|uniref:Uncharacterized protein n=1 Tax=Sediminitomix flava TaxID=379075 RepID=A0A315YSC2_SEDFL|nr:hypothetical protein [Sediminitomix flava]PWJ30952.1 hypothetical protein BC781_1263 [Sediminitomix flava]
MKAIEIINELIIQNIGLRLNLLNSKNLVQFSEQLILTENDFDLFFMDISMNSENDNSLIDILNSFINENKSNVDSEGILELLSEYYFNLNFGLEDTIRVLYQLNLDFRFNENIQRQIYWIEGELNLIDSGVTTKNKSDLNKYLQEFFIGLGINRSIKKTVIIK